MKKILIILVGVITLISCQQKHVEKSAIKQTVVYHEIIEGGSTITVYEYRMKDGCQYVGNITTFDDRARYLTHKGLCDNPKHKQ